MIRVENLRVQAGKFRLEDVSFEVQDGQYAALMGRTGSGKTTILEAIAGLKSIEGGRIILDDVDATQLKPAQRNIGYVPQDGALFPTMTVREQLGFALSVRHTAKPMIKARVDELADMLEITYLLDRTPHGLSGGEQQRVALGRAISFRPATLLFDEPLSALDEDTHEQMMHLLKRVQQHTGASCLHVTHSAKESRALADVCLRIEENGQVVAQEQEAEKRRPTTEATEHRDPQSDH